MDINYTTATYEEQEEILQRYCKFLNSLDCSFKITINNKNKDMEDLRRYILLPYLDDGFDRFRKIYNNIIEEKIKEGRQGIEQEKYLTITVERKNFEEAKAQFATIEVNVKKAFNELGTGITSLSGNLGPPAYPAHRGCRSREMKFAAANWWFALRPAFFQIFSVFVMRVLIMGLSSCYDGDNRRTGGSAARKAAAAAGDA